MNLPEGYGFVAGRSHERARALLDAADEAGVPQYQVRTTVDGYYAPEAVLDAYDPKSKGTEPEVKVQSKDDGDVPPPSKRPARKPAAKSAAKKK